MVSPSRCPPWQPERPGPTRREPRRAQRSYTTRRDTILSLVRYRTNDYSVPVAYGHREVWIRGYVHEVVIGCGGGIIARPPRSYERDDMVFDPIHYLPLREQKIAALDQAAPLAGWELPDAFPTLRRLLEARMMTDNTETWSLSNRVNREAATLPLLLAWTRRAKSVVLSKRYPK